MSVANSRPEHPGHLRRELDADPFAIPATPRPPAPAVRPPQTASPTPQVAPSAGNVDSKPASCPCTHSQHEGGVCGAATDIPAAQVHSPAMARLLRCRACMQAGHLPGRPTPTPHPRHQEVDPADRERELQIAREAEHAKWTQAVRKFDETVPEIHRSEITNIDPVVADRLERLRTKHGLHHTSLLCVGPYGSGKSWLMYTYARLAVRRRILWPSQIIHGTEQEILQPLWLGSYSSIREHEQKLLHPRVRMILIDDVGNLGRYRDETDRWALFGQVIDHAYKHRLALAITTNLKLGRGEALERYIGVPAYERLRSMVGDGVVYCGDKNMRDELTAQWEREYQETRSASPRTSDATSPPQGEMAR